MHEATGIADRLPPSQCVDAVVEPTLPLPVEGHTVVRHCRRLRRVGGDLNPSSTVLGNVVVGTTKVDRYKTAKLREGKLAPSQINKTLKRLSQILEVAKEYEHIARNPAGGRRHRVRAPKVERSWVEPEQAPSLLDGASDYMPPVVATLLGAGLRVGEAVALDWRDVKPCHRDAAGGRGEDGRRHVPRGRSARRARGGADRVEDARRICSSNGRRSTRGRGARCS